MFLGKDMSSMRKLMLLKGVIGTPAVEATATGNPLTFLTDLAKPLKSLLIPFTPQQEGSGDPAPDNVRNIVPWNGLSVFGGGKNLFDIQHATFKKWRLDSNNFVAIAKGSYADEQIDFTVGADNVTVTTRQNYFGVGFLLEACDFKRVVSCSANVTEIRLYESYENNATMIKAGRTCVIPANTSCFVGFLLGTTGTFSINIQIEAGQTASSYEEYKPITETDISIPSPVYGGTLDVVSGVLTVGWALFTAKWKDGINASDRGNTIRKQFAMPISFVNATEQVTAYCNVAKWRWNFESDDIHFFAHANNAYVFLPEETDGETEINIVGKLATPQTVQLTEEQITAIKGQNTLWSDADGSMTAVYLKKK